MGRAATACFDPPYVPPSTIPADYCKEIAFIGMRGTNEAPQGEDPVFSSPGDGMGTRVPDVYLGMLDEFDAHPAFGLDTATEQKGLAVQHFADDGDILGLVTGEYGNSIYEGVNKLIQMLEFETSLRKDVTDEKFVLAGYSKGALIIDIAMLKLKQSNPAMFDRILGSAMISDPATVADGAEYTLEEFDKGAGSGVSEAEGLWTQWSTSENVGPLPPEVASKTIAICRNHDIICAPPSPGSFGAQIGGVVTWPGLNYKKELHTDDYYKTKTDVLGRWIADRIMDEPFTL